MTFHDVFQWYLYSSTIEERKSLAVLSNRLVGLEAPPEASATVEVPALEARTDIRDENRYSTLTVDAYEPKSKAAKKWWSTLKASDEWLTAAELKEKSKTSATATDVGNALGGLFRRGLVQRQRRHGAGKLTYEYRCEQ